MKIVDRLLNRSEEVAFRELECIAQDNGLRVFAKTRLSDVIAKGHAHLSQREFDFFTRSHCDYVVTDATYRPMMVVEYDGPFHIDARQQERDRIKNALLRDAGLGLLRINDRHVTKSYRGMSVLRWIIEVTELMKAFDEGQRNGQIPLDEPFDPTAFDSLGNGPRFPYWLSAPATSRFTPSSKRSILSRRMDGHRSPAGTRKEQPAASPACISTTMSSGQEQQCDARIWISRTMTYSTRSTDVNSASVSQGLGAATSRLRRRLNSDGSSITFVKNTVRTLHIRAGPSLSRSCGMAKTDCDIAERPWLLASSCPGRALVRACDQIGNAS
jgi:very-short-patch-repair endonuclease